MVNLDFIGRKGEHILHTNRITVARRKIIVLFKFERERRKSYIWRLLSLMDHKVSKFRQNIFRSNVGS